jgi:hypothetical protein
VERSKYPRRTDEKRVLEAGLRGQRTQSWRLSWSLTLGFRRPFPCQARGAAGWDEHECAFLGTEEIADVVRS